MAGAGRYDDFADWYVEETASWSTELLSPIPALVGGERVVELACGYGRHARRLAAAGARVTGVDLSGGLLAHARQREQQEPLGVVYLHGDVTTTAWWDGVPFDGVVCEMALMDIDDFEGTLATVAAVLVDGGWFAFSIIHPCHPGGAATASGQPSWPPVGGYEREGWWSNDGEIGIRARVGANHRKLSTYVNGVLRAGFTFEEFREPPFEVPLFLAVRCRRYR